MQIQLEAREQHSIQAYSDTEIKINQTNYTTSLIVSRDTLITPWAINHTTELTKSLLEPLLALQPELILLGTHAPHQLRQLNLIQALCEQHIGVECMDVGAACRTFNILLGEQRAVVAGFILPG